MSNIYSNDDDLFEEYVDSDSSTNSSYDSDLNANTVDKVFSDIDSPFKSLLRDSSLKVNFTEAFYRAAHEWVNQGYREANTSAILNELVLITNGQFVYRHRIELCKESLARKKTIISFLNIVLNSDTADTVIKANSEDINFTKNYFAMFFRSYYNIQVHTFWHEVALYKSLCQVSGTEINEDLCDLTKDSETITDSSQVINDLYIKHFEKDHDNLKETLERNIEEIFSKNK
jgi:hypothetical protein